MLAGADMVGVFVRVYGGEYHLATRYWVEIEKSGDTWIAPRVEQLGLWE